MKKSILAILLLPVIVLAATGTLVAGTDGVAPRNIKTLADGTVVTSGGGGAVTQGTIPWVVGQATGTNLHVVVDTAPTTAVTQSTSPWVSKIVDAAGADLDLFRFNDLYTAAADHGLLILGQDSGVPARYRPLLTNTAGAIRVDPVGTTTQPVSIASMPSTPVTGTFWQATQPVSGTLTVSGTATPADTFANPANAVTSFSLLGTWNGSTWDRFTTESPNNDGDAGHASLPSESYSMVYNGATWDRARGNTTAQYVQGPQANNATITANPTLVGYEALSTQPAAATTGNIRRGVSSLDGAQYMRFGGPVSFSCGVNSIAASLTQCQAAAGAGTSHYITSIAVQTTTATSGTYAIQSGTGSNCGTSTTAVFPISGTANRFNAPINTTAMANIEFPVPIKVTAAHAICVIGVATNTISAQIVGFTAP